MILIDVGSSSVKIYELKDKKLSLMKTRTMLLKSDFETATKELFELVKQYSPQEINVYGTAIFRKLDDVNRKKFLREFKEQTGVEFNIISQEDENKFLQEALIHNYSGQNPVLLINIGGGSTELVVIKNKQVVERENIDLGVVSLLKQFPQINESTSEISLEKAMEAITPRLPTLKTPVELAFYSGGELRYMKLAGYHLQPNTIFSDPDHPFVISYPDYWSRNCDIFSTVRLEDLEKLMPDDPKWMHGARICSAFAQAICQKYGIQTIVPSDANLVNGIVSSLRP